MVIVKLIGGLGNQMFQYAFYLSLINRGINAKLDISSFTEYNLHNGYELEKIFRIKNVRYASTKDLKKFNCKVSRLFYINKICLFLKRRLSRYKYLFENSKSFDSNYFAMDNCYLDGYWQSEKYFEDIKDTVRETYIFPQLRGEQNLSIFQKIIKTNSIAIHIRRGDYINHPYFTEICSIDYYNKALIYIFKEVDKPNLFIFSDDIKWCRDNMRYDCPIYFIDWNIGSNSYIDMQLMSYCKHNIIANSTFSWWSAWLNNNDNKIVIAPSRITNNKIDFIDLVPSYWIKIEV